MKGYTGLLAGTTYVIAVGARGTIVSSEDLGETWTTHTSCTSQALYDTEVEFFANTSTFFVHNALNGGAPPSAAETRRGSGARHRGCPPWRRRRRRPEAQITSCGDEITSFGTEIASPSGGAPPGLRPGR